MDEKVGETPQRTNFIDLSGHPSPSIFIRGWTARFVNRPPMRNYPGPPFKSIHNFHSLTYGRIDGPRTAVYVLLLRHRCFIDDVACDSNQKALKPAHLT